jgi:hypothetical protein
MKKSAWLFLFMLISFFAFPQEFKKMKFGIGLGSASAQGSGGVVLFAEPAYRLNDRLALGVKLEGVIIPQPKNSNPSAIGSYTLTAQYYLAPEGVRPFVGLGAGIYKVDEGLGTMCDCNKIYETNKFGVSPKVGLEYNHLLLSFEYNVVTGSKYTVTSIIPGYVGQETGYNNNNYFTLKLGLLIGGGKKKKLP